jgi:predicted CopG family antitoxin
MIKNINHTVHSTISNMKSYLKPVYVSEDNYQRLKNLGRAGDSLNDVITNLIKGSSTKQNDKDNI